MQLIATGERVIRNHHGTERLPRHGDDGDVLFSRHVMRQNEINLICGQGLDQFFGGADPDVEANVGMGCLELGDGGRQQFASHGFRGSHAHLPAHEAAKLLNPQFDRLQFRDHQAGIDQKSLAGRSHANAPWQALEQGRPEIDFEVKDLAVQSR